VTVQPDAGLLVRIDDSLAAERSRVKLSLRDLPVLPEELVELCPRSCAASSPDVPPGTAETGPAELSICRGAVRTGGEPATGPAPVARSAP
jgi:NAD+ kinase